MHLKARLAEISDLLRQKDYLSVERIAEQYKVTTQTARRYVNELCENNLAKRKYGGIESLYNLNNLNYVSRQALNLEAKRLIAKKTASKIPNGSSISLGIGTSPEMVARELSAHKDLQIYTNNIVIAQITSLNSGSQVYCSGGRIRTGNFDILGDQVVNFFNSYKTDFGIYSVGGVDKDGSLLDFTDEEVQIKKAIINNCRERLLIVDYEKFGRTAHVRGGNIKEVDKVFCDKYPPSNVSQIIIDSNIELIVCNK